MTGTFIHSSMMGSYTTACKIVSETDDEYLITYFDRVTEEDSVRWLPKDTVEVQQ
jgi:hypothetical protein